MKARGADGVGSPLVVRGRDSNRSVFTDSCCTRYLGGRKTGPDLCESVVTGTKRLYTTNKLNKNNTLADHLNRVLWFVEL
jgi:hypothetical protein